MSKQMHLRKKQYKELQVTLESEWKQDVRERCLARLKEEREAFTGRLRRLQEKKTEEAHGNPETGSSSSSSSSSGANGKRDAARRLAAGMVSRELQRYRQEKVDALELDDQNTREDGRWHSYEAPEGSDFDFFTDELPEEWETQHKGDQHTWDDTWFDRAGGEQQDGMGGHHDDDGDDEDEEAWDEEVDLMVYVERQIERELAKREREMRMAMRRQQRMHQREYEELVEFEEESLLDLVLEYSDIPCPLCWEHELAKTKDVNPVMVCECGFKLDTKDDFVTFDMLRQRLEELYDEHSTRCDHEPQYELQDQGLILYMSCGECDTLDVVV